MIDAGPSLEAAKGLPAADLLHYLLQSGWTARPSRVEGISIVSKDDAGFDKPILFILPVTPGWEDEQRRVADALRTVEAIEQRPMASIVNDVHALARRGNASDADQSLPMHGAFRDDPAKD